MLQTPKKFIYGFGLLFAAVLFTHSVCYGAKSVQLSSCTWYRCPLLIHWLEDNPMKTTYDAPLQYQSSRKTVGIGEKVDLKVEGDAISIGDTQKVEWMIVEGADRAVFRVKDDSQDKKTKVTWDTEVTLHFLLGDASVDKKKVRVLAKMTTGVSVEIEFQVRTPDGDFLSRHYPVPRPLWVIGEGKVGASAKLRIYPTPGEASFSGGIGLLEIDGGSPMDVLPSYGWFSLRKRSTFINFKHDPPKTFFRIGYYVESGMEDDVGFQRKRGESWIQEWFIPEKYLNYENMGAEHSAYWLCDWYWRDVSQMSEKELDYDGNPANRGTKMKPVYQRFKVLKDGSGTGILTKFQSQVKRAAKENEINEQEYGQIQNP